jgi:O-antigen ligase
MPNRPTVGSLDKETLYNRELLIVLSLILCAVMTGTLINNGSMTYLVYLAGAIAAMIIFIRPVLGLFLLAVFLPLGHWQAIQGIGITGAKGIAGLLLVVVIYRKVLTGSRIIFDPRMYALFAAFLAICFYSYQANRINDSGMDGIKSQVFYIVLALITSNIIYKPIHAARVFDCLLLVMGFTCLVVLTGGWGVFQPQFEYGTQLAQPRAAGSFDDPNKFATILLLVFPLGLLRLQQVRKRYARMTLYIVLGLMIMAVITTYSRSAWLTIAVIILSFVIIYRHWKVLLIVCLFITLGLVVYHDEVIQRLKPEDGKRDPSIIDRKATIQAGMLMFYDHPLFGVGINQSNELMPEYKDKTGVESYNRHVGVHNVPILILIENGLLGFMAYFGFAAYLFIRLYRRALKPSDDGKHLIAQACLWSMLAFYIQNQFQPFIYIPLLWLITGIGIYAVSNNSNSNDGIKEAECAS